MEGKGCLEYLLALVIAVIWQLPELDKLWNDPKMGSFFGPIGAVFIGGFAVLLYSIPVFFVINLIDGLDEGLKSNWKSKGAVAGVVFPSVVLAIYLVTAAVHLLYFHKLGDTMVIAPVISFALGIFCGIAIIGAEQSEK